ncbi:MAG: response regulator [Butyricicoccaceae bacterium]
MKATILLAEDERICARCCGDYFTAKSGGELTMISAPDGNMALHLIETQPFDLLLLDIMLPGTDGFALCRAARNRAGPILFITAREDETVRTATVWCDDDRCQTVFACCAVRQSTGSPAPFTRA